MVLSLTTLVSLAQEIPKFKAKVKLSITADDAIKAEVTSYMARELRELADVTLTDENPSWELSIIAVETNVKDGQKSGVVISMVVLSRFNPYIFQVMFEKAQADASKKITAGLVSCRDHRLQTGASADLKDICQKFIADFDTTHLSSERKSFADALKEYEKTLKK